MIHFKVLKTDTSDINLHKSPSNVDIGMAAMLHLREYKQKPHYKDSAVTTFQKEASVFKWINSAYDSEVSIGLL